LSSSPHPTLAAGDGTLNVSAQVIDLTGQFDLQNIANANFTSSGDIRLYTQPVLNDFNGATQFLGYLVTTGNVTLKAADIYPATANSFIIHTDPNGVKDACVDQMQTTVTRISER